MQFTRRCTLISSSAIVSQNQRAKIDMSVRRALPVHDNENNINKFYNRFKIFSNTFDMGFSMAHK